MNYNLKKFLIDHIPNILIVTGLTLLGLSYFQYGTSELTFYWYKLIGKEYSLDTSRNIENNNQRFLNVIYTSTVAIKPVDTNFGIVVEKIDINAPIVKDVSVINSEAYMEALKSGVAHASFSGYPDQENANVYLFAHSSNNFWQLGKYSTVFNLIYKLNIKDPINIFYKGKRYVYQVENKILVNDFKVDQTIFESIGPTLTLQTCYPAGTTLNRLIVRASLVGVFDYSN
jgi:sortase A